MHKKNIVPSEKEAYRHVNLSLYDTRAVKGIADLSTLLVAQPRLLSSFSDFSCLLVFPKAHASHRHTTPATDVILLLRSLTRPSSPTLCQVQHETK